MAISAKLVKELRDKTGAGMMDCKKALEEVAGDIDKAIDVLREKGLSKAAKKADRIAAEGLVRLAFSEDGSKAAIVEVNSETDFVAKNAEFIEFVEAVAQKALEADVEDMDAFMALPFNEDGTVQEALTAKISKIGEKLSIRRFQVLKSEGTKYVGYVHGGGTIGVIVGLKTPAAVEKIVTMGKDVAMQVASMSPKFVNDSEVDQDWLKSEEEIARQQLLNEGKKPELLDRIIPGKMKSILKEVCLVDQKFVKNSDQTVGEYVAEAAKALGEAVGIAEMVRYEVGEGIEKRQENFAEEVAAQMGK